MTTKEKCLVMMHKAAAAKRLSDKVMAKRAEYRAQPSDAYVAGFCKAAGACGVDGAQLLKEAQGFRSLGSLFEGKWLPKYIDLLKGGGKARVAIRNAFRKQYGTGMKTALKQMEGSMNELTGQFQKGLLTKEKYLALMDPLAKNYAKHMAPLADLERNVALARWGTGGALAAGGLYGLSRLTGDDNEYVPRARGPVQPYYV